MRTPSRRTDMVGMRTGSRHALEHSRDAKVRPLRLLAVTVSLGVLVLSVRPASAVSRTCGTNAVANTTNVLCASPSGPCTPTSVTMNANIEVTNAGCEFDLGGRTLSIQKTLQMTGAGFIKIRNVGNITITSNGKLKARGDFVQPQGFIIQGGLISLESTGTITHSGTLDVSGDPAGVLRLSTAGDITLHTNSLVQANGITSFVDDRSRFADGGSCDVLSTTGNVTVAGDVVLTGTNAGLGGVLYLQAARALRIDRPIDASGGGSDGGVVGAAAGDDLTITKSISVESRGGGGFGGEIILEAGEDAFGGVVPGGALTVDGAVLQLGGSSFDGFGGDGGELYASAYGPLRFIGTGVAVRANAGAHFDGYGGSVEFDSSDLDPLRLGPLDGDITLEGTITAQGGDSLSRGGDIEIVAGRNATINATIDVNGKTSGGDVAAEAGAAMVVNGVITAQATDAAGFAGSVDLRAGFAQDATLTIAKDILAAGGANNGAGDRITLAACALTVSTGVKIDGHAGTAGSSYGGSVIELIARRAMQLQGSTQFLAYPGGRVTTIHPPAVYPVIGGGVVFNPPRVDQVVASGVYPACPTLTPSPTRTATPTPSRTATPTRTSTPTPLPIPTP